MTRRLLVIDDEVGFCKFVARVAAEWDFEVETTSRAADFTAAYERSAPDVIVLDIVMPDMDGLELIQWLAQKNCHARVLIISGFNPAYARMAEALGIAQGLFAIKSLTKPLSRKDLAAALTEF